MTRCDYDVLFYRVFCLSLLVIAFIFTVILTNVFVDIDGLLSKKEKAATHHTTEPNEEATVNFIQEVKPEVIFNEDKNYNDPEDAYRKDDVYVNEEEAYRTKRSLEVKTFLSHLQNPNVKNILTTHLNALLEQMDAEEFTNDIEDKKSNKIKESNKNVNTKEMKPINEVNDTSKVKNVVEINDTMDYSTIEDKTQNELLHLAMHDILLQGIIGHMDLNEVLKKVNVLSKRFNVPKKIADEPYLKTDEHKVTDHHGNPKNVENKFFEELIQCKELQNQIRHTMEKEKKKYVTQKADEDEKPQMIVKTTIDISSKDEKHNLDKHLNYKEIQGVVKLIYNGKPVKVKSMGSSEENNSIKPTLNKTSTSVPEPTKMFNENELINQESSNTNNEIDTLKSAPVKLNIPQSYLNNAVANYFKKYYPSYSNHDETSKSKRSFNNKRFKRHIKIHYDPKNNITKSEDDELYVEIETHFDSKGMKGEKRKKLIRNLIQKIESAIHSDIDANKTKKHYHAHVKKRLQNPLVFDSDLEQRIHDANDILFKKISPIRNNKVEHRHLGPITKSVDYVKNDVPNIYDKFGETWKKTYLGPTFLTPSKALNSAELSELDVDYKRVMTFNGIPQRLQKPLNTENSDEAFPTNYYDLGNLKFYLKDVDGSGISVGFNQYTDEEPDSETMKIFTGVDNLVRVYNHNYGKTERSDENNAQLIYKNQAYLNNNADIGGDHTIIRRSAVAEDYHSNEYKMIYDTNFLPYDNYQDIFDSKTKTRKKHSKSAKSLENGTDKSVTMDIFSKKLKPSEIFSLANMLEEYRKKRSITVKRFSNINTRRKLSKYFQTKSNKLFINNKRLKRHIDKIRIIASDKGPSLESHNGRTDEQNIFVVSNEDEFSNRAVLRDISQHGANNERVRDNLDKAEEVYDFSRSQPLQNYMSSVFEENQPVGDYVTHIFDSRSRHNPLMAKYPHVFMEEISKSKESEVEPGIYDNIGNVMSDAENIDQYDMPVPIFDVTTENYYQLTQNVTPRIIEPGTKAKYKLSVKILPKNLTELKTGFKEIHTSINKSYDKDGLRFYSLVNVSEISKVENIENTKKRERLRRKNVTMETTTITTSTVHPEVKAQQFKMKSMLKRHKQMIDAQLAHLKKEKEHLDNLLVLNHTDSDEVMEIKLPGESLPLQIKKGDVSKLLAKVLRIQHNDWSTATPKNQQVPSLPITTTIETTTTPITTPAPITIPNALPMKATDKKLINIIEKNGKLTKEILNKIDRNTEMLEAFLVKLLDKIEKPAERHVEKPVEFENNAFNKPNDVKNFPTREEYSIRKSTEDRNDTNYAIPFIYAYQHPYMGKDKKNSAVANIVYHGHIHTDNPQLPSEVLKVPNISQKGVQNTEVIKHVNKGKFFIDNDLGGGFKSINSPILKSSKYTNSATAVNATHSS